MQSFLCSCVILFLKAVCELIGQLFMAAFYGGLFVTGFSFHGSFLVSTEHIWSHPSTTWHKSSHEARGGGGAPLALLFVA